MFRNIKDKQVYENMKNQLLKELRTNTAYYEQKKNDGDVQTSLTYLRKCKDLNRELELVNASM